MEITKTIDLKINRNGKTMGKPQRILQNISFPPELLDAIRRIAIKFGGVSKYIQVLVAHDLSKNHGIDITITDKRTIIDRKREKNIEKIDKALEKGALIINDDGDVVVPGEAK